MKLLKWKQITWIIVNMAVLVFLSVYLITAFEMMIEYHWMCYGASLIVIFAFCRMESNRKYYEYIDDREG